MKKLVKESLNEDIITNLKSFWKYGPSMGDKQHKDEVIDLIHQLSLNNENVSLFDEGLKIGDVEINTKHNFISLSGSEIYLTRKETLQLYNEVLKRSFVNYQ